MGSSSSGFEAAEGLNALENADGAGASYFFYSAAGAELNALEPTCLVSMGLNGLNAAGAAGAGCETGAITGVEDLVSSFSEGSDSVLAVAAGLANAPDPAPGLPAAGLSAAGLAAGLPAAGLPAADAAFLGSSGLNGLGAAPFTAAAAAGAAEADGSFSSFAGASSLIAGSGL